MEEFCLSPEVRPVRVVEPPIKIIELYTRKTKIIQFFTNCSYLRTKIKNSIYKKVLNLVLNSSKLPASILRVWKTNWEDVIQEYIISGL